MTKPRLFFLDWIRILAFFVLILYHTGMYYVTWDWHVKSPYASNAIEPLMILSSPWRLGLLFMISGVATAFMLQKLRVGALLRQRSWRLLVPLVFGMFVIVPPQSYFEVVEKIAYHGSYAEFMRLYVSGYHGFCRGDDCLRMPTWNHLWFVAYLWAYTMIGGLIVWLLGAPRLQRLSDTVDRLLSGWRLIALPVLVLAAARYTMADRFPTTHALVDDWYSHAQYFFLFALGTLMAMQTGLWARIEALRWTSLALWLSSWALVVCYWSIPEALATPEVLQWKPLMRAVYCLCQWTPILTVCGFGHRHLNFDSAKRRYLTEAVFPVYILHQTLIVVMAHWMKPINLAPGIEGVFLIVLTFTISFGVFELVRRVGVLRPLFGLGRPTTPVAMTLATPASGHPRQELAAQR